MNTFPKNDHSFRIGYIVLPKKLAENTRKSLISFPALFPPFNNSLLQNYQTAVISNDISTESDVQNEKI